MTIIIGINYGSGIIMASDLLEVSLSGTRRERKKIHYKDRIMIGWAGTGFFEDLKEGVRSLLANFSVEEIVAREFSKFSNNGIIEARKKYAPIAAFDVQPPQLDVILGYKDGENFRLLYDDGSGTPLKQRGKVEVLYPNDEDISDFISAAQNANRQLAIDLAASFIRGKIGLYPDEFSGLEVLDMNHEEIKSILYEGVSQ